MDSETNNQDSSSSTSGKVDGKPKQTSMFLLRQEIHRKKNSEYYSPALLNILYCFYFQFVCKCSPIVDEDIYDIDPRNKTELVTKKAEDYWGKQMNSYRDRVKQYEESNDNNPQFDVHKLFSRFHRFF